MSFMETFKSDVYDDGQTKQSFRDSTNINKILARAAKGDTISHLAKYGAVYGDFSEIDDLLSARSKLDRGMQIFKELPGEIRKEFDQDPGKFFRFVNDPGNAEKLGEVLPHLAQPGRQMPTPTRTQETEVQPTEATPVTPAEPSQATPSQG